MMRFIWLDILLLTIVLRVLEEFQEGLIALLYRAVEVLRMLVRCTVDQLGQTGKPICEEAEKLCLVR